MDSGVKLQSVDRAVLVLHRHDLPVAGAGGDGQAVRQGVLRGGQGVIAGRRDGLGQAPEQGTVQIQLHLGGLAVHELLGVGHHAPKGLADGLVPQAHPQDGESRPPAPAPRTRTPPRPRAGRGRERESGGRGASGGCPPRVTCVVAHHLDVRVRGSPPADTGCRKSCRSCR